jgi:hypothetical protein
MAIGRDPQIKMLKQVIKLMNQNKIEFIKLGQIEIKKTNFQQKSMTKLEQNRQVVVTEEEKRRLEEEELFWSSNIKL